MSNQIAISFNNVGKMYKLYANRLNAMLDVSGLGKLRFWKPMVFNEFWALRNINLEIKKGMRIGIIGRNGAGKTTLLKLIGSNYKPTEGFVEVRGNVKALLQSGAGFHPDFSGYENIRASLAYQSMSKPEIEAAIKDIEEFTELDQFLNQPFKTYSAGMQARLTFATATTVKPEILIVDEILGAGDGYFVSKSSERMKKLVMDSGATVLVVSHSTEQILKLCEKAIWLERGQIVKAGNALEVVKAYQQFLVILEERKLKKSNKQRKDRKRKQISQIDVKKDIFTLRILGQNNNSPNIDVSSIILREYKEVVERIMVGGPQDNNENQDVFVSTIGNANWSSSKLEGNKYFRTLEFASDLVQFGEVIFKLTNYIEDSDYQFEMNYRCEQGNLINCQIFHNNKLIQARTLDAGQKDWITKKISLKEKSEKDYLIKEPYSKTSLSKRHWHGEGYLSIYNLRLLNEKGENQVIFQSKTSMTANIQVKAHKTQKYKIRPVLTLFRKDGLLLAKFRAPYSKIFSLKENQLLELYFDFAPLILGENSYIFSVGLFKGFFSSEERYDLIDRAFEFQVKDEIENTDQLDVIFQHPGKWRHLVDDK